MIIEIPKKIRESIERKRRNKDQNENAEPFTAKESELIAEQTQEDALEKRKQEIEMNWQKRH